MLAWTGVAFPPLLMSTVLVGNGAVGPERQQQVPGSFPRSSCTGLTSSSFITCILSNIGLAFSHHGMGWCWTGSLFLN